MGQVINAIYAISENHVIGRDNEIPWKLSSDLKRYKRLTMGHPIIMGRKTFESIGKPLPGRRNIVITRNPAFIHAGIEIAHSLENALQLTKEAEQVFLVGGAGIFLEGVQQGLVTRIYETLVHADVEGDVIFELPDEPEWEIQDVESHQADEKNEYAYTYRTLIRK